MNLPVGVGWVRLGHLRIRVQDDDVVRLGPLVVAGMHGIGIADEGQRLLAAVERHVQAAGHLATLTGTGHIEVAHIAYRMPRWIPLIIKTGTTSPNVRASESIK